MYIYIYRYSIYIFYLYSSISSRMTVLSYKSPTYPNESLSRMNSARYGGSPGIYGVDLSLQDCNFGRHAPAPWP